MRITILAVGRLREPWADAVAHYEKLMTGRARLETIEVREENQIERRIPERAYVSLLDERGKAYDSENFALWMEERRQSGLELAFVLGGPFGVHLERHDHVLSLGPMTLPFQLARVVLLEQVYRAHKILAGEPYHH
jgi:23S rRNA (pseudouridine1915-N3)-methyltransferase